MNDITVSREMLQRMINAIDMLIPTLPGLRDKGRAWLRDEIIKSADELRAALAEPAMEPVAHINSNGVVHAVGYPWEAGEVLTPLYASPPPPAKPAVEPFGYFRAEPFGWTDCAPTDEGAKALYEVPPAAAPPLTDEAIAETMANVWGCASIAPRQAPEFARAIERLIKGVRL